MGFTSVMKKVGQDIEKVFLSPWFQTGVNLAEGVIGLAVPALGPLFNATANAVMTTEANFAAVGKSSGTGQQKLASVVAGSGNLIQQLLKDAGVKDTSQTAVENYISAVVSILNAVPAGSLSGTVSPAPTEPIGS